MVYITCEREMHNVSNIAARVRAYCTTCSNVSLEQNDYYGAQDFCVYQRRT